ncbi:MAG: site-specific DNA-methyltransferase [Syntrophaceae bacterium]|nr:site-specific DNA-methyltransferase [Syntrophaceae bacterium]
MYSCDENEVLSLGQLLIELFGSSNHVETITWNKRVPKNDKGIGNIHEYVYLFAKNNDYRRKNELAYIMRKDGVEEIYEIVQKAKQTKLTLKETQVQLKQFYKKQGYDRGITLYCEIDPQYEIWGKINMSWPNPKSEGPRYQIINPVTKKAVPIPKKGWRWTEDTFRLAEDGPEYLLPDGSMMKGRIWYASDENTQPSSITYLREVESFLLRSIISLKSDGSLSLENLGLSGGIDYPKPPTLIEWLIYSISTAKGSFLDFFAGSGTSGHATINLNREDGGRRKFILVEMAHYFDTVLLPRIKKVTFSHEWKDGKPKRMATTEETERSPRIVKVLRLESYEDALNNIAFDDPSGQQAMQFEDYLLQYMLKWETRHSETLLNVERLDKPFSYQLHIHRDGETRTQSVDLPETFNYLLGLNVRKRFVVNDGDRPYLVCKGDNREGRKVAVIWRETEGWKKEDYARDKAFVAAQQLTEGVDDVYVNGDSYIPGAWALEPLFKARMFADVEA